MITVEMIMKAKGKAKREYGSVYIVYTQGGVKVWANSRDYNPLLNNVEIIKHLDLDSIECDNVTYKDVKMGLQALCDRINEDYKKNA